MERSKEIWEKIPGYDGLYEISNHGRVRSWNNNGRFRSGRKGKPKILKPSIWGGYLRVTLSYKNSKSYPAIHILVGKMFVSNPDNKPILNHKNGIKTCNYDWNLRWSTYSENNKHAVNIGLRIPSRGENVNGSKLIEEEVLTIRAIWPFGWFIQTEPAEAYGVDQGLISNIVNFKIWTHI